jgi:hypothetical protein
MMLKKKREEIAHQIYLTKSDIRKLLNVSVATANRIYSFADEIDNEMKYRVEPIKVRITSVSKVIGVSVESIKRQAGAN